jgi:WD40 repeat protein
VSDYDPVTSTDQGKKVWTTQEPEVFDFSVRITSLLKVEGDKGYYGIVGLADGRIYTWELASDFRKGSFYHLHDHGLLHIAAGSEQLLSFATDGTASIFKVDSKAVRRKVFVSEKNWPTDVAISGKGGIAAITDGCELIIFDVSNDQMSVVAKHHGDGGSFSGVEFSSSGQFLAAGSQGKVVICDTRSFEFRNLSWPGSHIDVFWSSSNQFICSMTHDRELHIWDLESGKDFRLGGFGRKVRHVAWNRSSTQIAAAAEENVVIWRINDEDGGFDSRPVEVGCGADCGRCSTFFWITDTELLISYEDGSLVLSDALTGAGRFLLAGPATGEAVQDILVDGDSISYLATQTTLMELHLPSY